MTFKNDSRSNRGCRSERLSAVIKTANHQTQKRMPRVAAAGVPLSEAMIGKVEQKLLRE
jgi:hypothetical protein